MPESKESAIALAGRLYQALAIWDRPELEQLLHPNFQGHATPGLPLALGGDYDGPADMLQNFWGEIGRNYRAAATPERYSMSDQTLFVQGHYVGQARSGGALDAEFTHVLTFADSRIMSLSQLTDSARWSDALRYRAVDYSFDGSIATITLNRPKQRNAIDQQIADELMEIGLRLTSEAQLRAVLIQGAGDVFTVGGDLKEIAASPSADLPQLLRRMITPFHQFLNILAGLSSPIVCAVQGAAAGGGLGLIYASDVVIASDDCKFSAGFGALGLTGDGGGTWFLPRLVGQKRAAQFYLQQRVLGAREALDWGIITAICAGSELKAEARTAVEKLAAGPTTAFGEMRRLLQDSSDNSLSSQLQAEIDAIARAASTRDAPAAIQSFLAKSTPVFTGE